MGLVGAVFWSAYEHRFILSIVLNIVEGSILTMSSSPRVLSSVLPWDVCGSRCLNAFVLIAYGRLNVWLQETIQLRYMPRHVVSSARQCPNGASPN